MNENTEERTAAATEKQKSIKAKIKTIIISFVSGVIAALLFVFRTILHNNRSGINATRSEQSEVIAASGRIEERSGDIETISRENAKIFEKIRNRKKDN